MGRLTAPGGMSARNGARNGGSMLGILGEIWGFAKQLVHEVIEDEVMTRAASVAFWAALSLAPMVLLFVAITGYLGDGTQERMIDTVTRTVGQDAGEAVRTIAAEGSGRVDGAGLSLFISIAVIIFSASTVMAALQLGLNRIWGVRAAPDAGLMNWVRKRLLSMGMVLGIGFLLLVSMVATTLIGMVMPPSPWLWNLAELAVSFGVFVLLFAAIFKFLPDVMITWKQVWIGALITAGLFAVGKYLISLYIARAGYSGSYGAAGSLVAMLVWVYYSAVILYLGAEITQVYSRWAGNPMEPSRHAVRVWQVREET